VPSRAALAAWSLVRTGCRGRDAGAIQTVGLEIGGSEVRAVVVGPWAHSEGFGEFDPGEWLPMIVAGACHPGAEMADLLGTVDGSFV
jgi:hypothetical protein